MNKVVRDEGLILRAIRFRESSLIVSTMTKRHGRIKLLAKGARRPKSIFGASLESFMHVRLIFYLRENKDLYTLSDTEILDSFIKLRNQPVKIITALGICEFIDKALPPEHSNTRVFRLALQTIKLIENSSQFEHLLSLLYSFLFIAAGQLGYEPNLKSCVRCKKKASNLFSVRYGGLVCSRTEDKDGIPLPGTTINELKQLSVKQKPVGNLKNIELVENLAKNYILYHFDGIKLETIKYLREKDLTLL